MKSRSQKKQENKREERKRIHAKTLGQLYSYPLDQKQQIDEYTTAHTKNEASNSDTDAHSLEN